MRGHGEETIHYGLPPSVTQTALVGYRSVGIGLFGAAMRWAGMPLEKIALYMNSSQVTGKNPFAQAVRLTFAEGVLSPYRVVGPASLTAWFMQYSVMGVAFQFFDQALSNVFNVRPMYYGKELMSPPDPPMGDDASTMYNIKASVKTVLSPVLAAHLESFVSNRAEAQRFFGPTEFAALEKQYTIGRNPLVRAAGPVCSVLLKSVVDSHVVAVSGIWCQCGSERDYVSNEFLAYTSNLQTIFSTRTQEQEYSILVRIVTQYIHW